MLAYLCYNNVNMVTYEKYVEQNTVFDKYYYTPEPTESITFYTFVPTIKPDNNNISLEQNELILIVVFSTISGMMFIFFILYYTNYQKRKNRNTFIQKIIDEEFGTRTIIDNV